MKRGLKPYFLFSDKTLIGINFSADFTAEHQHGIDDLNSYFRTNDTSLFGIERHRIRYFPEECMLIDHSFESDQGMVEGRLLCFEKPSTLSFYNLTPKEPYYIFDHVITTWYADIIPFKHSRSPNIGAAWDQSSFGILVKGDKYKKYLAEIYQAMVRFNAALWLGGGAVFQNGGLCIAIISRIPDDSREVMRFAHEEQFFIENEHNRLNRGLGLEKKLKEGGLSWVALSPYPVQVSSAETKYQIRYWLNPIDQEKYRFGWVTVEELLAFIKGDDEVLLRKEEKK